MDYSKADLPILILQIGVILFVARNLSVFLRLFRQPPVAAEMLAGLMLGPSFLGRVFPDLEVSLFPPENIGTLSTLGQFGILVYLFVIGLEIEPRLFQKHLRASAIIGTINAIVPFCFGFVLALCSYPYLSAPETNSFHFALFLGVAFSITAFPVLARMLSDRRDSIPQKLVDTAILSAATTDLLAWYLLSIVILLVRSSLGIKGLVATFFTLTAYLALMVIIGKQWANRFNKHDHLKNEASREELLIVALILFASAWITDKLGIHAILGAFMAGLIIPKQGHFALSIKQKLEDFSVVFLLPIFFATTGLRTSIDFGGTDTVLLLILAVCVATIIKFSPAALAARACGLSWRESGALGILMNTRGLMELVVLNIGLDLGLISKSTFSIMVIVTIATTLMTAPTLELLYPKKNRNLPHRSF